MIKGTEQNLSDTTLHRFKLNRLATITFWVMAMLMNNHYLFAAPQSTSFEFYSEDIGINYEQTLITDIPLKANNKSIKAFHEELKKLPFQPLTLQLMSYRRDLHLNGYLYYDLIHNTANTIFASKSDNYKTLVEWYLLTESGFDARLTHIAQRIYLYALVNDDIYNTPIIQLGGRDYINLTELHAQKSSTKFQSFFVVDDVPNPHGEPMTFRLKELPKFKKNPVKREIRFAHHNELYTIEISVDQTIIDIMAAYPLTNPSYYIEAPLSDAVQESLLPKLREIVSKKTQQEAIQFLLSFTRNAFDYKTDADNFGRNKPMIPDEVLFYHHSDCEDRSALFYALVKELVGLPVIIVDYPDHLTVGVALQENIGKPLYYQGRKYTICDPTGPSNTYEIGIYPKGYEELPYRVALSYR